MCTEQVTAERKIETLVPELDDLILRRRIAVKDDDEIFTDMNARQIAKLAAEDVAAFNRVFREHREVFDFLATTSWSIPPEDGSASDGAQFGMVLLFLRPFDRLRDRSQRAGRSRPSPH